MRSQRRTTVILISFATDALTVFDESFAVQKSLVLGFLERLAGEKSVSVTTDTGRRTTTHGSADDNLVHGHLVTKVRSKCVHLGWSEERKGALREQRHR